jgi:hypothetical protein
MSRYLLLFGLTVVVAAGIGWLARRPRVESVAPATPSPTVTLELTVRGEGVTPSAASVPKDHRVALRVFNAGSEAVALTLAGYEDRVAVSALAPGESSRVEFLADRPGDDLAWLVDGRPAGRLQIRGSHLVEGHR